MPSSSGHGAALAELGPLRNGLGSIQNLELLLGSIRVGQKDLFAAVAAVHSDCATMRASLGRLAPVLTEQGTDAECAEQLAHVLRRGVSELESALAPSVQAGRLSAARRLALEAQVARASSSLGALLPLVALLDRAAQSKPTEPAEVGWVHGSSAEGSAPARAGSFWVVPELVHQGLAVDLAAARLLIVIAAGLVLQGGTAEDQVRLEFAHSAAKPAQTRVTRGTVLSAGPAAGLPVRIAALDVVEESLLCAQVAARRLGGSFEHSSRAHGVCISWPLS
jgi:hypothetical protein